MYGVGNGPKSIKPFFSYSYDNWNSNSFIENVENISMALDRAVQRNLVSDVNLSLALSGGIDSSLIYDRILKNKKSINALTISFKRISIMMSLLSAKDILMKNKIIK